MRRQLHLSVTWQEHPAEGKHTSMSSSLQLLNLLNERQPCSIVVISGVYSENESVTVLGEVELKPALLMSKVCCIIIGAKVKRHRNTANTGSFAGGVCLSVCVFGNFTLWDTLTSQLPPLHQCTVIKICLARKTTAIKQMHLLTCFINSHIKDSHTACSQLPLYRNECAHITIAHHQILTLIYRDHIRYKWFLHLCVSWFLMFNLIELKHFITFFHHLAQS